MFELPKKPQSIGKVVDNAFRLFRAAFRYALPLAVIYSVMIRIPSFFQASVSPMAAQQGAATPNISPAVVPVVLAVVVIGMIAYIGLVYSMDRVAHGEAPSLGDSLKVGLRKILPLIGVGILYALSVLLGYVLLIIPGVILSLSLCLAYGLVITEDGRVIESLKRSHRLVWGNWWRTLAELTIVGLVYYIPFLLVGLVIGVTIAASGGDASGASVAVNIATIVIGSLLTPLLIAGYLSVLYDRRLRSEGGDLEARLSGDG